MANPTTNMEVMAVARSRDLEPVDDDEMLFEEYMLSRASRARVELELQTMDAVTQARNGGLSWDRIGDLLGMPGKMAERRYGPDAEETRQAV